MKKIKLAVLTCLLFSTTVFSQKGQENPGRKTVPVSNNGGVINLLSPANSKSFNSSEVSRPILFRWTALMPKPKEPVTYRLRVWQLMQGQSGNEAMRSNQPVVAKEVANLTQAAISNLYTGPCKPPYLCDFVWNVSAINSNGGSSGISELFGFKIIFKETGLPDTLAKAVDHPGWENFGREIICERQGIVFQAAKKVNVDEYIISCTFRERKYYETGTFHDNPPRPVFNYSFVLMNPGAGDLYCDQEGRPVSIVPSGEIWEVTETNPNTQGGTSQIFIAPVPTDDFHTMAVLWNSHNEGAQEDVEVGCKECELGEGWESGWEGGSEWIEWEIEHEENRPPDTTGSFISPGIIHNGEIIRGIIRDRNQANELKNMGMVLSDKMPANSVKCSCGKNVWAKDKEGAVKICAYLKTLLLNAKDSKGTKPHTFTEKIVYDADSNVVAMVLKTKNGRPNVLIDEVRILELSKEKIKSLAISKEEYSSSLRKYLTTGEPNPKMGTGGWPIKCWKVPCDGSCGEPLNCDGYWVCKWVGFAR